MPSEGDSLRHSRQIAQYRFDLVWRKYRHHLGQDAQYLPGHVLGGFEGLLGGLLLGVLGFVSHLHRIRWGQPGAVHPLPVCSHQ